MAVPAEQLAAVEQMLEGATWWGAELEPRYRVLATTLEPTDAAHPLGDVPDRRLQVLFFPVHTILGVLRGRDGDGRTTIERFEVELLVDVVASFDGGEVRGPLFDRGEPAPGEWGPAAAGWSVEGRATTIDGKAHDLRLSLRGAGERAFDLYATFDEISIRTPHGDEIDPAGLSA